MVYDIILHIGYHPFIRYISTIFQCLYYYRKTMQSMTNWSLRFPYSFVPRTRCIQDQIEKLNKKRSVTVRRVIIFLNISRHPLMMYRS
jgi:hypothetical protein